MVSFSSKTWTLSPSTLPYFLKVLCCKSVKQYDQVSKFSASLTVLNGQETNCFYTSNESLSVWSSHRRPLPICTFIHFGQYFDKSTFRTM